MPRRRTASPCGCRCVPRTALPTWPRCRCAATTPTRPRSRRLACSNRLRPIACAGPAHASRDLVPPPDLMPAPDLSPRPPRPRRDVLLGPAELLDIVNGLAHAGDLLGVLVRDLDPELHLEGHHELHRIERVRPEIVHERGVRRHFLLVDSELLHDDALDLVCNRHRILLAVHAAVDR